jgi:hypothetical protein
VDVPWQSAKPDEYTWHQVQNQTHHKDKQTEQHHNFSRRLGNTPVDESFTLTVFLEKTDSGG